MTPRIVQLLDRKPLTRQQLAQRKYRATAKGKAAMARYRQKRALDAAWRTAEAERVRAWEEANPVRRRVYKRIWRRMKMLRVRRAQENRA